MSQPRKSKKRLRERQPQLAASAVANRRLRWPLVLTALVSVGAGAALVERLTRPTGEIPPSEATVPETAGQNAGFVPPPPVQLTTDELTADANQLADEVADAFADDPDALAMSGRVSFMLGSSEKAQERWEQSVQLNPKSADAWLGMAELARKQGDLQPAVEYMQRLAEVNPDAAQEKVFVLADCLLKLGQAREVVDVLEDIGKLAPLPGWAQVMLGQAYYQLKEYERSLEHYRQALDDPQQAVVAHYGLSLALVRLDRQAEAEKAREEYAKLQQENLVAFDRLQHAGTSEERQDPAAWHPILARFHCQAGRLYAHRDQLEQARRHWLRACALAPDRPEPRQLLESLEH